MYTPLPSIFLPYMFSKKGDQGAQGVTDPLWFTAFDRSVQPMITP
jgi:hypothetical protein